MKFLGMSVDFWIVLGLFGQLLFGTRFLIQWIYSELKKESVIPLAFWYFSLAGGMVLLTYAIHRKDPVFILGQSAGAFVYIRNLILIYKKKAQEENINNSI